MPNGRETLPQILSAQVLTKLTALTKQTSLTNEGGADSADKAVVSFREMIWNRWSNKSFIGSELGPIGNK